jgi:hypothetical protein
MGGKALQLGLETVNRTPGAVDVGANAGPARLIAHSPEPCAHEGQREITGHEPGDEQDWHAVAASDTLAAEDGVATERGPFEANPCLLPNGNP